MIRYNFLSLELSLSAHKTVLYISFVGSIMKYSPFVYFLSNKTSADKLEAVQYSAIRMFMGFRISAPRNLLIAELKLPRLDNRAMLLGRLCAYKVLSNTEMFSAGDCRRLLGRLAGRPFRNRLRSPH